MGGSGVARRLLAYLRFIEKSLLVAKGKYLPRGLWRNQKI